MVREPLDGKLRVGAPLGEAGVVDAHAHPQMLGNPALEDRGCVAAAVHDDLGACRDPLALQRDHELGVVEPGQPACRERDRPRDVAAAHVTFDPPAVVSGQRPRVDDAQVRLAEPATQLRRGDRLPRQSRNRRCHYSKTIQNEETSSARGRRYPKTVKVLRSLGVRVLPNSYVPMRRVTVHLTEPLKRAPVERVTPGPESLKPSFVERSLTVIT